MQANRREFVTKSALLATTSAAGLTACTTGSGGISLSKDVIDAIQAAVAKVCSYIPQVATLIAIVANFPALNGAATIAGEVLTNVTNFLCSAFKDAGGTQAALEAAASPTKVMKMKAASGDAEIHGLVWNADQGKFVQF